MSVSRRAIVLFATALCASCASASTVPDPIVGRWRDVRHQHIYEFFPGGLGRFELYVPPEDDPMLSAVLTPDVSWRRVRHGYEITLQTPGLDGGVIMQRNSAEIDGARLVTDVRQREGTLTLERVS